MKKPIYLFPLNKAVLFFDNYKFHGYGATVMRDLCSLEKILRKYHYKFLPTILPDLWFTDEFKSCGDRNDAIILFDSILTIPAANYIQKKYPNLRVIYWFWNHIYNPQRLHSINKNIELWSYDAEDCSKYGIKYNTQFYFKELATPTSEISQDFFFIGAEKGRSSIIKTCSEIIEKSGLSKKIVVIDNTRKGRITNWMQYDEVIKQISSSKCVVDLVPKDQKGITIRPLEALFNNKKLITNFKEICNCDFYSPSNIFVIGKDDPENLRNFINSPMVKIEDNIIDYYSFDQWLQRFNYKQ